MDTTYDVKFWKTSVYEGRKKTTYTVRWELEGKEWRKPFGTVALADSFRAGLVSAARKGRRSAFPPVCRYRTCPAR